MWEILVITVGKTADKNFKNASERYAGMVKGEWRVHLASVKSSRRKAPDLVKRDEGTALLKRATGRRPLISLDENGRKMTSDEFSSYLAKTKDSGQRPAFLIGGAFGLHEAVIKESDISISLSSMTLPHELATTVLTEQIYRAYTKYTGRPYSK